MKIHAEVFNYPGVSFTSHMYPSLTRKVNNSLRKVVIVKHLYMEKLNMYSKLVPPNPF